MNFLGMVIVAVTLLSATVAYGQYYVPYPYYPQPTQYYPPPPPQPQPYRPRRGVLSEQCRIASEHLKANDCGPEGCDVGLCIALAHGCHINSWGHVCKR